MKRARDNYDFRRQEELALQRQRLTALREEARVRETERQLAKRAAEETPSSVASIEGQIRDANDAERRKFFEDVLRHGPPPARPDILRRRDRQQMAPDVLAREDRQRAPTADEPSGPGVREWLAGLQAQRAKVETEATSLREAIQSIRDAIAGQGGNATSAQNYELRALSDALNKANSEIDRLAAQMSSTLGQVSNQAYSAGQQISSQLAAGIRAGGGEVSAAMSEVAGRAMRNVPQSPAKDGPFRYLRRGGQEIAAQLASGIGDNSGAVSDRMRTMAAAGMSASRQGGWALPRPSAPDAGTAGGASGGGSGGGIAVSIDMGGVTIAPNGQSLDDMSRTLGERVAARIGSSLHESRA